MLTNEQLIYRVWQRNAEQGRDASANLSRAAPDAYRAGISAAAVELRRQARELRRTAGGCPVVRANASALEIAADSLAELPGGYEPSGLEYRGG